MKKVNPFKKREKEVVLEDVELVIRGLSRGEYLAIQKDMKDDDDLTEKIIDKCVSLKTGEQLDIQDLPVDIYVKLGEVISNEFFSFIPKNDEEKKI